ncbi:response regulator [Pseudorhizobium flavum]|uniref:response regulator n=1 Tax=Pseudorhizobium flavum TaxID=1335061 RepID=UPI002491AE8B|nr:response regulator [Pseudorhizobium flavum]
MLGMTGRELADEARKSRSDLKVLYTSGYTRNAIVHGGRLDEGVDMIGKPFTYSTFAQKVADVLEQGRTGRALLVEDEPTLRMFAAEALVGAGYAVDEAVTRAEALSRVRAARGRYDAVILDVVHQAGLADDATANELRALHADLPVLLCSGTETDKLAVQFADDRCAGVIAKPYNAAKLLHALRSLGLRCRK